MGRDVWVVQQWVEPIIPSITSLLKSFLCHISTHTHTQLVMSSDKLGSIQRPVLDLDLDISESGHKRKEHLELSREELEALLSSLDAAGKVRVAMLLEPTLSMIFQG